MGLMVLVDVSTLFFPRRGLRLLPVNFPERHLLLTRLHDVGGVVLVGRLTAVDAKRVHERCLSSPFYVAATRHEVRVIGGFL